MNLSFLKVYILFILTFFCTFTSISSSSIYRPNWNSDPAQAVKELQENSQCHFRIDLNLLLDNDTTCYTIIGEDFSSADCFMMVDYENMLGYCSCLRKYETTDY